jgi:hypothetical protein
MNQTPLETIRAAVASALATDSPLLIDAVELASIGFWEQVIVTPQGLGIRLWVSVPANGLDFIGWADYSDNDL